jgi:hypothetical protein
MSDLYSYLKAVQLDSYYDCFSAKGMTLEGLSQLTMQEYSDYGIHAMDERKRLFQLVQMLKTGEKLGGYDIQPISSNSDETLIKGISPSYKKNPITTSPTTSHEKYKRSPQETIATSTLKTQGMIASSPRLRKSKPHDSEFDQFKSMKEHPKLDSASPNRLSLIATRKSLSKLSTNSEHSQPLDSTALRKGKGTSKEPSVMTMNSHSLNDLRKRIEGEMHEKRPITKTFSPVKHKLDMYGVPTTLSSMPISAKKITGDRIRVCVRKRPLCFKGDRDITHISNRRTITINEPK